MLKDNRQKKLEPEPDDFNKTIHTGFKSKVNVGYIIQLMTDHEGDR